MNSPYPCAMVILAMLCASCDGFSGKAGDRPEGFRLVEGRVRIPDDSSLLGRQVTGLQLAALHLIGGGGVTADVSGVFDPSVQRNEAAFVATVRDDVDFVLVLQVPSATQRGPGSFLGVFLDGDETLLPRGEDDVNLGVIDIVRGARVPADTVLRSGPGSSPAAQTDSDGDGLTNDIDDDDDEDGIPDVSDPDRAGDGIDDALQILSALPDDDGDGVPDLLK